MSDLMEKAKKSLEAIALEVVTLESGDIPSLGNIMNAICSLEGDAKGIGNDAFSEMVVAVRGYLEKLILADAEDINPLEDGIDMLQAIYRSLDNQEDFKTDIAPFIARLGCKHSAPSSQTEESAEEQVEESQKATAADDEPVEEFQTPDQDLSEEDRQIMGDFVIESQENLATIEVSLIDLEQDPSNFETINDIFRPFHTIKGVSGFLALGKINKLSHSAENLLDKARNGEMLIDGTMVDIILESVDMLKKMIRGVQDGLGSGSSLDNGIDIIPLIQRIESIASGTEEIGEKPIGEILINKGALSPEDLESGLLKQKEEPEKKIGEILVEENKTEPKEVISALRDQKKYNRKNIELQVKVDTKKLDNLVDLTGELVINQSMLRQNLVGLSSGDQKLSHNINQMNQITSSLQMTAMAMRMVPVKNTFQKMVRLVRDLAKNAGKEVGLEMTGEDTEIDRNVVEELYEPMVHMIRNAADHGIELPAEREKLGKPKKGTIHLEAYHRGGNIIIEIEDDGRGLNKDRIIEKAKSGNLISDENRLTEAEIFNLIFEPGFSTAKEVTDVSGRGVGMDVVKKAIEKLRGRVEIISRPGQGSTFVISLPLTLAIIEGMIVRVGQQRYIIPALAILESFRPSKDQYSTVEGKAEMILTRGSLIPLVRLHSMFGVDGDSKDPWEGLVVSVEHDGDHRCLMLDELLGKEEVVIKSLGESLKRVKGIAGGAIMGDGKVGLILDMAGIFEIAQNN